MLYGRMRQTHDRSFSPGFQGRPSFKLATSLTCGRISDLARFRLQHSFNNSGPTFGPYKRSLRSFSSCKRRSCDGICSNATVPRLGLRSRGFLRGELEDFLRQTLGRDLTAAALFDLAATKAHNGYPPKMGVCTSGSLLKIGWIIALRRDRCGPGEVGIIFTIINLKSITEKLQNCIPPGGRWLLPTFCKSHTMTPCGNSA